MEQTANVRLHIVEAAFGHRRHEVAQEFNEDHLLLRTQSEAWVKESMINAGMRRVIGRFPNARYLAWLDSDVFFRDAGWAQEAMHQLQHHPVIQPWSDCSDLGPQGNISQSFKSFGRQHQHRIKKQTHPSQPYQYAHTGFAWCCTRAFWEQVEGLMDFPPLGSADHHMAFAMTGQVMDTVHGGMHENFKRRCRDWQRRAMAVTHGEVGYVAGRIEHEFHGPKKRRYYRERWQILIDHGFDPDVDLMRDEQGLIRIHGKPCLEQAIRMYNRARMEDSIEEY